MNTTKYPRTFHLPWSEGITSDDKIMTDLSRLQNSEVVVTEKMDGENTTIYWNYLHARSVDGRNHPSRSWVKGFAASIQANIIENWRVCGENLYARHSIGYEDLPSYFLGFSLWDDNPETGNRCFSWDDTIGIFEPMGVTPVREMYRGKFDEKIIRELWNDNDRDSVEGYVVRVTDDFLLEDFSSCVGKFVRKDHVNTDEHWMSKLVIPNGLQKR